MGEEIPSGKVEAVIKAWSDPTLVMSCHPSMEALIHARVVATIRAIDAWERQQAALRAEQRAAQQQAFYEHLIRSGF